jgi:ABC-type bacteriocin/lantibiotic exporter with double-glycine peptidase domain
LAFYESSFIVFGLFLIVLLWLILKYTSNLGLLTSLKESNDKYELASWLEDIARAVRTFKFSQNSDLAVRKSDELASIYLQDRNKHFSVLIVQYKALIAFKVLITAAMLGIGTYLLIEQKINIGEFIAAEIVILMVIGATEKLIYHLDSL